MKKILPIQTSDSALQLLDALITATQWASAQGMTLATGGNFSVKTSANHCYVTASGKDKSCLTRDDFLQLDLTTGQLLGNGKPSAETALHRRLYQLDPEIGCVLHTHSVTATVLSQLTSEQSLAIEGLEMQKSLLGNQTHQATIELAVFENDQDIDALADQVTARWQQAPLQWGLLVRGHGLYCWGNSVQQARQHLEGIEFLLQCQLQLKLLGRTA